MCGGIGNQMFQYALYKTFELEGKLVKLDLSGSEKNVPYHGGIDIFDIFGMKASVATIGEINDFSDNKHDFFNSLRRRVFGRKKSHVIEKEDGNFDESVFHVDNVYLDGFWQSEKYFCKYKKHILDQYDFSLTGKLNDILECNDIVYKILDRNSCTISIHFRFGDYLKGKNRLIYGNICTEDYYERAIQYFSDKYDNPVFICFSDNIGMLNKYRDRPNFYIANFSNSDTAWIDMYFMSKCKHNIIANSTFSWWGAWLNQNFGKEVIAPKRWINTKDMLDVCPDSWIRL